ncbi:uncharacterized protein MEPE_04082 [Melanopsichium pennsylvanicum]|uniref:Carboxylesterase type B domain-containing protein n=1 Tax=Melanopsichium pennsylvanicum TaxID=63383 RepID=A0AAJ4XQS7_9BASI|nr:uncharacterized protein MEPE_04082 [Melanopsichium pennsylvanicum]
MQVTRALQDLSQIAQVVQVIWRCQMQLAMVPPFIAIVPALHGNNIVGYFGHPSNAQSPDFVKAFMNIYSNFVTKGNLSISAALVDGSNSSSNLQSNAAGDWPKYSASTPYQINLNQTAGTPSTIEDLGEIVSQGGSGQNSHICAKVNAYTWEGGKGQRCN